MGVSRQQVSQMLTNSRRLNEMKAEIDATVRIALGLLTESEVSRFHYDEVICQFITSGLNWKVTMLKRGYILVEAFSLMNADEFIYSSLHSGASRIGMGWVKFVHWGLPDLLTNLAQIFPDLAKRFDWLSSDETTTVVS